MSDHFSGPRVLADPVIDITDVFAFPSPERSRDLVLILNVFPNAGPSAFFSDAVIHRFRIRSVLLSHAGRGFTVGTDELAFDVTFDVPITEDGDESAVQRGQCIGPNGESVSFRVNDEKGGGREGLRVFGGLRLDPFIMDIPMFVQTLETRKLAFKEVGTNSFAGTNVLGIVLQIDWAALLKGGPMFAVVCETLAAGKRSIRLDRVGRPEIKNVVLWHKGFDQVNRDLEIRDLYNDEDAFNLSKDYKGAFRARMNANLAFYDGLDGRTDWPADEQGNHPLTELLLADFLVVDASHPFCKTSYFEIERAMLKDRAHATSGGRWLEEDVIDTLFTTYVNGGNGPGVSDGVDTPSAAPSMMFPYMAPPNPSKGG